jgi:hypothetical protein
VLVLEQLCSAIDEKRNLDYEVTKAHMGRRCPCLQDGCPHEPPLALFIEKPGFSVKFLLSQALIAQGKEGYVQLLQLEPLEGFPMAKLIHAAWIRNENRFSRGPSFFEIVGDLSQAELQEFSGLLDFETEQLKIPLLNRIYDYLWAFENEFTVNLAKYIWLNAETLETEETAREDLENPL